MPFDTDTFSFVLTYGGTLLVALLMFIGQLTAVGILLILAGITPSRRSRGHSVDLTGPKLGDLPAHAAGRVSRDMMHV